LERRGWGLGSTLVSLTIPISDADSFFSEEAVERRNVFGLSRRNFAIFDQAVGLHDPMPL
jgi:hypothetical protein